MRDPLQKARSFDIVTLLTTSTPPVLLWSQLSISTCRRSKTVRQCRQPNKPHNTLHGEKVSIQHEDCGCGFNVDYAMDYLSACTSSCSPSPVGSDDWKPMVHTSIRWTKRKDHIDVVNALLCLRALTEERLMDTDSELRRRSDQGPVFNGWKNDLHSSRTSFDNAGAAACSRKRAYCKLHFRTIACDDACEIDKVFCRKFPT
jgi:hypothetical protein